MNTPSATQDLALREGLSREAAPPAAPIPGRFGTAQAVPASKHCFRCDLDMDPPMMAFHKAHAHLVLHCQLCRTPIAHLGISRADHIRGQYCSSICKSEAARRGLCIACSKVPDGTFKRGMCLPCRASYVGIHRQISQVNGILFAIESAQVLPMPYQRLKPGNRNGKDRHE